MNRYEALRTVVTGASPGPYPPRGLAMFLRRGLARWMLAWPEPIPSFQLPKPIPPEDRSAGKVPAGSQEVVLLLVEMALQAAGR